MNYAVSMHDEKYYAGICSLHRYPVSHLTFRKWLAHDMHGS